jgi:Skp family chaperone for outer membrane proteins
MKKLMVLVLLVLLACSFSSCTTSQVFNETDQECQKSSIEVYKYTDENWQKIQKTSKDFEKAWKEIQEAAQNYDEKLNSLLKATQNLEETDADYLKACQNYNKADADYLKACQNYNKACQNRELIY